MLPTMRGSADENEPWRERAPAVENSNDSEIKTKTFWLFIFFMGSAAALTCALARRHHLRPKWRSYVVCIEETKMRRKGDQKRQKNRFRAQKCGKKEGARSTGVRAKEGMREKWRVTNETGKLNFVWVRTARAHTGTEYGSRALLIQYVFIYVHRHGARVNACAVPRGDATPILQWKLCAVAVALCQPCSCCALFVYIPYIRSRTWVYLA